MTGTSRSNRRARSTAASDCGVTAAASGAAIAIHTANGRAAATSTSTPDSVISVLDIEGVSHVLPNRLYNAAPVDTEKSRKSRLGELLVSAGNLSDDQLETALERQKSQKLPLGQLLVKLGFVTDDAMRMALASQVGVPFIDLDNTSIDPGLGRVLNKNFARRHVLVPVAQQGRTLTIAMDDPTKRALVDDITRMTGLTVTVVTSSNLGLQRALKRLYDDEPGVVESGPSEPGGPK